MYVNDTRGSSRFPHLAPRLMSQAAFSVSEDERREAFQDAFPFFLLGVDSRWDGSSKLLSEKSRTSGEAYAKQFLLNK